MPRRTFYEESSGAPNGSNDGLTVHAPIRSGMEYRSMRDDYDDQHPDGDHHHNANRPRRSSHRKKGGDENLRYAGYQPPVADPNALLRTSRPSSPPLDDQDERHGDEEDEVYIVRQDYGYCSIFFSLSQTVILAMMMWQCGVAPMKLNPMLGPYPDALSEWGGKNSTLIVADGQWWRLITPIMLHAGIIHLAGNVAVQLELGVFFEREWGSLRWLIVYLGSGVGSSMLSVVYMPNAVSVGSSGAVMGLFGAKLSELVLRACERRITKQQRVAHQVRREQGVAVTCSVIVVLLFSFVPYVDWAAHLGGLLAGIAIGLAVFAIELEYCAWKLTWFVIGGLGTFVAFSFALRHMYSGEVETIDALRDVCGYYKENFPDYECNCMREAYFANGGQEHL